MRHLAPYLHEMCMRKLDLHMCTCNWLSWKHFICLVHVVAFRNLGVSKLLYSGWIDEVRSWLQNTSSDYLWHKRIVSSRLECKMKTVLALNWHKRIGEKWPFSVVRWRRCFVGDVKQTCENEKKKHSRVGVWRRQTFFFASKVQISNVFFACAVVFA